MDKPESHPHVIHPRELLKKDKSFNVIAFLSAKAAFETHNLVPIVNWVSSNWIQLVLLPAIMVAQNVAQKATDAKADADHMTLTYLANLQDQQMVELKNQGQILEVLQKNKTS
jgi:hypothetical protein